MLVIRLARTGKKHQAYFRIVVAEKRRAVSAKFIEILGNYNPHEKDFKIDQEKLKKYLDNGAQPSNTVAKLLKLQKIDLPKWVKIAEKNKSPKKPEEEKPEPKAVEVKPDAVEEVAKDAVTEAETPAVEEETTEKPDAKAETPATEEVTEKEETAKTEEPATKEESVEEEASGDKEPDSKEEPKKE